MIDMEDVNRQIQEHIAKQALTKVKRVQALSGIDLEKLKQLVIKNSEAAEKYKTCTQLEYPMVMKEYNSTRQAMIDYSNDWVNDHEVGLVIFEVDNRIYSIKERFSYKYIGYVTKPNEVEL